MSETLRRVLELVKDQEVKISVHGYDEMAEDGMMVRESLKGVSDVVIVEDYSEYPAGPCVLVLQKDREDKPVHVVSGIPKRASSPAVVVTAYRPDPKLWSSDFMRRNP